MELTGKISLEFDFSSSLLLFNELMLLTVRTRNNQRFSSVSNFFEYDITNEF